MRGRSHAAKVGIFHEASHEIVDIARCPIHAEPINLAAAAFKRALRESGVSTYSEAAHAGIVRYLQLAVERRTQTVQVVVVANTSSAPPLAGLLENVRKELGDRLHSLWFNGNSARTNAILGPEWELIQGPFAISDTVGGAAVFYPPGAFGQSHPELANQLVQTLHSLVSPGKRVVELYAGVGPIGLGLAGRASELVLNESAEHSLQGLALGLAALGADAEHVRIVPGEAAGAVSTLREGDIVIVDPPRKGLDPVVRQALIDCSLERILYVSCSLQSFLRDARQLIESQRYKLVGVEGWGLFPFSNHLEILAWFDREG